MKRTAILLVALALTAFAIPCLAAKDDGTLTYGRFGTVHLYKPAGNPEGVVLFISGDGGWNLGVIDMARELVPQKALVVGIDIRAYLKAIADAKDQCTYAAADFEALSQYVQKELKLPRYMPPVIVGYSSGATLAYATIVQAPVGTFRGAISMGFCPDLPLKKPFCKGNGLTFGPGPKGKGYSFEPSSTLETPWIAFQGQSDQVCDPPFVDGFVAKTANARVVRLEKVGHGFSVTGRWLPQLIESYRSLNQQPTPPTAKPEAAPAGTPSVSDLPLVEVPAAHAGGATMAVFLSGDGGWATFDREISGRLALSGIPVVGWNSLQYYWTARTPEGTAKDLDRVLRHYGATWNRERVILVGYSFGADVLPFLVNRLPDDLRGRIDSIAMIGLSPDATFEFHVSEWIGHASDTLPVKPEIERLRIPVALCLYGSEETDSLCPQINAPVVKKIALSGGHHMGGDYDTIAGHILGKK